MKSMIVRLAAIGAVLFATAMSGFAFTLWSGGNGYINDTNNWTAGLPDNSGNDGFVSSSVQITAAGDDLNSKNITFASSSLLDVTNELTVTDADITFSGASALLANGPINVIIGNGPGGIARFTINGPTALVLLTGGDLTLGGDSNGEIVQSSGTVQIANGLLTLGGAGGGTGKITMTGGVVRTESITYTTINSWVDLSTLGGELWVSTNTYSVSSAEANISNGNIRRDGLIEDKSFFSIIEDGGFIKVQAIPEPTVIGLIGIGGMGLLINRRITKRKEVE